MDRLAIADYSIGAIAVILVIYSALSNLYFTFHEFTYYAALPTIVILVPLYFLHRYIYKLRNNENKN
ncbi:MAG: hypothetical protein QXZ44_05185 [Ferroplasma sp.]